MEDLEFQGLDFDENVESLKKFLQGQAEFQDYNFEGSTISMLLRLLAYNTSKNAFYTSMLMNESFLDTSLSRDSVISKVKLLGYLTKSAKAARAKLQVYFNPNDNPSLIVLPKGSRFAAKYNLYEYGFITTEEISIPKNGQGRYVAEFYVTEGVPVTQTFTYSSTTPQKMLLLNKNIDVSTLKVSVKPSSLSTQILPYSLYKDLTAINADSRIYYLQEDIDDKYEVSFGDGVLGKKLENGNQVICEYVTCNGVATNDLTNFAGQNTAAAFNVNNPSTTYAPSLIVTLEKSFGGLDKEGIEAIKYNAPKYYKTQNRNVTASDYTAFVKANFPDIQVLSIWGGEENDPPIYGKCFLSIKPNTGYTLNPTLKAEILDQLNERNVLTIDPVIVEPDFTFIQSEVVVRYNANETTKSAANILATVSAAILEYERNELGIFRSPFRYSKYLELINECDPSIKSNETKVKLEKRFTPNLDHLSSYRVKLNGSIEHPYNGFRGGVISSGFSTTLSNETFYFEDDGFGKLKLFYLKEGNKVYSQGYRGSVNYATGLIKVDNIIFTDYVGDSVIFYASTTTKDYFPVRNEIILLDRIKITVVNDNNNNTDLIGYIETQGSGTIE